MSFLQNIGVSGRVRLACGGLVFATLATGGGGLYQASHMEAVATDLARERVPSVGVLGQLAEALMRFRQLQAATILASDADRLAAIAQRRTANLNDIAELWKRYGSLVDAGEEADKIYPAFQAAWNNYLALDVQFTAAAADKGLGARLYNVDSDPAFQELRKAVAAEHAYNERAGRASAENADAAFNRSIWLTGGIALLVSVLGLTATMWLDRTVTARVIKLAGIMRQLARRDYGFDLPCATRSDEIGDMARAMDDCRTGLKQADALAATQATEQASKAERGRRLDALTGGFESKVGQMTGVLASAATELQATAQAMSGTAGTTSERAEAVMVAANQASGNVQTVAAAAEQLVASVREITRQVAQSAAAANKAVADAHQTQETVRMLAEGAERIGHVVNLINGIAGQTNLLALNATIEAARAGDAGKGFAVVASEVKALASQTARATEEISTQIGQIQTATQNAVTAIGTITETIGRVSETTAAIAAAVEEQGAATQEIARNVQEAAFGTQAVTQNINAVSHAAEETGEGARSVLSAANNVTRQMETLDGEVRSFLSGVRAA